MVENSASLILIELGVVIIALALLDRFARRLGISAIPLYLPAPHEVATAFYTAFTTEPKRRNEKWLHESLWSSIQVIFWGFVLSSLFGVPLGILAGTYDFVVAKLKAYLPLMLRNHQ